jgi:hypothetical protein
MNEFVVELNRTVNFSAVTIEDCLILYREKRIRAVIEDGKISYFEEEV